MYARNSIYSSENIKNAQKIIDEVVNPAKKTKRAIYSKPYISADFSFAQSNVPRYEYYCNDIEEELVGGSKRFTLRNNNNNNNSNNNSNNKPISRKIRKHASTSMPTTRFTKKQHNHNKKHKTRRHKH